ncbi:MAG TPA: hypothetical protein VGO65_12480 [Pseudolysinimonas sp.]|nr:hypothetical protein [Pseudolysinimonas sp.]
MISVRPILAAVLLGSALALAGCAAAIPATTSEGPVQQATGGTPPGGRGVSGTIAAASDGLLQVQDANSQTAVSYTSDTTIQSRVAGALSDVTVGSCVTVMTGGTDTTAPASTVSVSAAIDGACTVGFGGGMPGGGGPGGGTRPTGAPTGGTAPSGAPTHAPGGGFGGGFTNGLVTAVSGDTITIDAVGTDGTTTSTDVKVDATSTYTTTIAADATALVVGQCVSAQGTADDSGGYAATTLTVSEPGDNGCVARFGGAGAPGGAAPGAGQAG